MPAAYLKEPLRLRDFLQAGVSTNFVAKLFSYTVTFERFLIGRLLFLPPQVTQQGKIILQAAKTFRFTSL